MRIKARAVFDPNHFKSLGIPSGRGFLLLEIEGDYRDKVGAEVKNIVKRQADKHGEAMAKWNAVPPEQRGPEPVYRDALLDLELDLTIHYQKRSVDANALYWAVRAIQANWANSSATYRAGYHAKFLPGHVITPQELHDADVETYCERKEWTIMRADLNKFKRAVEFAEMGRVTKESPVEDRPDRVKVVVTKSTSFFNTKEFREWTNRMIREVEDGGILRGDEPEFQMLREDFRSILKGEKKR